VPQGEIVGLPFELLIEPDTSKFVIERWVVSYAPNASMAYRALTRPVPSIKRVTAIVDNEIGTGEVDGIRSSNLQLDIINSYDVMPDKLGEDLRGAESAHLLLHGAFDAFEPLLSTLTLAEPPGGARRLLAASLLALPLSGVKLVVLSACESGEVQHRISNEIYGFPWVLIADGAENVLTSRWRVKGDSNGRWMRSFYASIADGASPAEAAAAAVRAMLKEDGSKPYYWAAMQVSGR
jgi:CHAT domain-containing protein